MARKYKEIEVPSRKELQLEKFTCDLCGTKAPNVLHDYWGKGSYDVAEVTITLREGASYPEGGSGITTEFDVCPHCFKTKLIPWFEDCGARPLIEKWDY